MAMSFCVCESTPQSTLVAAWWITVALASVVRDPTLKYIPRDGWVFSNVKLQMREYFNCYLAGYN
jgi:hypothetical protein